MTETKNVKKPQHQMCEKCRKLRRFFQNKTGTILVSMTHFILKFAIAKIKFQQTKR